MNGQRVVDEKATGAPGQRDARPVTSWLRKGKRDNFLVRIVVS